jgi:SGNH domain (fused to AT3 domains)
MLTVSRFGHSSVKPADLVKFDMVAFVQTYSAPPKALRELASQAGAILIDPLVTLCPGSICPVLDETGRPLYMDGHHLSASYARSAASYIEETLIRHSARVSW